MINIIPLPNEYESLNYDVKIENYRIVIAKKYENAALQFNTELDNKLTINVNKPLYTFEFEFNAELSQQQYTINMQKDITYIEGGSENAMYYATRSLAQLFKLNTKGKVKSLKSMAYEIKDSPRFLMRSFMIDEVRHFFKKDEIYKMIDLMADLKFNYFHWHLSDDQGFRIDFKNFPELKRVASKRCKTKINSQDNDDWDYTPYEFCYSYEDIKDVIYYAKQKYIEIIPEVDVPGHTSAIVAAYPFLHCFKTKNEVRGDFGVFKDIMCPGKDETLKFTLSLFDEILKLFKDSKYIHIGGDEVSHENWKNCPDCQKKIKDNNLKDEAQLQAYFSNEVAKHILQANRKVIMWNDGMYDSIDSRVIMQYWDWKMDEPRIKFINDGRKTIYSPCSQFYFNDPYSELPLKTTYDRGIHLEGLNKNALKNIIAMEGCIWSEWVTSDEILEFNTNPRLQALSEACWTNMSNHNFKDFLNRMNNFHNILDYKNIKYASNKLACANGKKYREKVSKEFRANNKSIELIIDKKEAR